MAAFGQTFDSNAWLLRSSHQLVYPKIEVGATTSVGDQVWVAWWLTTWVFVAPPFFDKGRLLHSTWLTNPQHSFPHSWPLIQRTAADVGQTVWNNWWFNTQYTAPNKLAFFAGRGPYSYAGKAASLGALHRYSLVLAAGPYAYQGATAHSDFGVRAEFIPYITDGSDIVSPPNIITVVATAIGWSMDPVSGVWAFRRPGDVFLVARGQFSDARIDYLAGLPGSPLYGWMTTVDPSTPLTNPTDSGVPVYDYQPPPRRLVF